MQDNRNKLIPYQSLPYVDHLESEKGEIVRTLITIIGNKESSLISLVSIFNQEKLTYSELEAKIKLFRGIDPVDGDKTNYHVSMDKLSSLATEFAVNMTKLTQIFNITGLQINWDQLIEIVPGLYQLATSLLLFFVNMQLWMNIIEMLYLLTGTYIVNLNTPIEDINLSSEPYRSFLLFLYNASKKGNTKNESNDYYDLLFYECYVLKQKTLKAELIQEYITKLTMCYSYIVNECTLDEGWKQFKILTQLSNDYETIEGHLYIFSLSLPVRMPNIKMQSVDTPVCISGNIALITDIVNYISSGLTNLENDNIYCKYIYISILAHLSLYLGPPFIAFIGKPLIHLIFEKLWNTFSFHKQYLLENTDIKSKYHSQINLILPNVNLTIINFQFSTLIISLYNNTNCLPLIHTNLNKDTAVGAISQDSSDMEDKLRLIHLKLREFLSHSNGFLIEALESNKQSGYLSFIPELLNRFVSRVAIQLQHFDINKSTKSQLPFSYHPLFELSEESILNFVKPFLFLWNQAHTVPKHLDFFKRVLTAIISIHRMTMSNTIRKDSLCVFTAIEHLVNFMYHNLTWLMCHVRSPHDTLQLIQLINHIVPELGMLLNQWTTLKDIVDINQHNCVIKTIAMLTHYIVSFLMPHISINSLAISMETLESLLVLHSAIPLYISDNLIFNAEDINSSRAIYINQGKNNINTNIIYSPIETDQILNFIETIVSYASTIPLTSESNKMLFPIDKKSRNYLYKFSCYTYHIMTSLLHGVDVSSIKTIAEFVYNYVEKLIITDEKYLCSVTSIIGAVLQSVIYKDNACSQRIITILSNKLVRDSKVNTNLILSEQISLLLLIPYAISLELESSLCQHIKSILISLYIHGKETSNAKLLETIGLVTKNMALSFIIPNTVKYNHNIDIMSISGIYDDNIYTYYAVYNNLSLIKDLIQYFITDSIAVVSKLNVPVEVLHSALLLINEISSVVAFFNANSRDSYKNSYSLEIPLHSFSIHPINDMHLQPDIVNFCLNVLDSINNTSENECIALNFQILRNVFFNTNLLQLNHILPESFFVKYKMDNWFQFMNSPQSNSIFSSLILASRLDKIHGDILKKLTIPAPNWGQLQLIIKKCIEAYMKSTSPLIEEHSLILLKHAFQFINREDQYHIAYSIYLPVIKDVFEQISQYPKSGADSSRKEFNYNDVASILTIMDHDVFITTVLADPPASHTDTTLLSEMIQLLAFTKYDVPLVVSHRIQDYFSKLLQFTNMRGLSGLLTNSIKSNTALSLLNCTPSFNSLTNKQLSFKVLLWLCSVNNSIQLLNAPVVDKLIECLIEPSSDYAAIHVLSLILYKLLKYISVKQSEATSSSEYIAYRKTVVNILFSKLFKGHGSDSTKLGIYQYLLNLKNLPRSLSLHKIFNELIFQLLVTLLSVNEFTKIIINQIHGIHLHIQCVCILETSIESVNSQSYDELLIYTYRLVSALIKSYFYLWNPNMENNTVTHTNYTELLAGYILKCKETVDNDILKSINSMIYLAMEVMAYLPGTIADQVTLALYENSFIHYLPNSLLLYITAKLCTITIAITSSDKNSLVLEIAKLRDISGMQSDLSHRGTANSLDIHSTQFIILWLEGIRFYIENFKSNIYVIQPIIQPFIAYLLKQISLEGRSVVQLKYLNVILSIIYKMHKYELHSTSTNAICCVSTVLKFTLDETKVLLSLHPLEVINKSICEKIKEKKCFIARLWKVILSGKYNILRYFAKFSKEQLLIALYGLTVLYLMPVSQVDTQPLDHNFIQHLNLNHTSLYVLTDYIHLLIEVAYSSTVTTKLDYNNSEIAVLNSIQVLCQSEYKLVSVLLKDLYGFLSILIIKAYPVVSTENTLGDKVIMNYIFDLALLGFGAQDKKILKNSTQLLKIIMHLTRGDKLNHYIKVLFNQFNQNKENIVSLLNNETCDFLSWDSLLLHINAIPVDKNMTRHNNCINSPVSIVMSLIIAFSTILNAFPYRIPSFMLNILKLLAINNSRILNKDYTRSDKTSSAGIKHQLSVIVEDAIKEWMVSHQHSWEIEYSYLFNIKQKEAIKYWLSGNSYHV